MSRRCPQGAFLSFSFACLALAACGEDKPAAAPAAPSAPTASPGSAPAPAAPEATPAAPAARAANVAPDASETSLALGRGLPDTRPGTVRGRVVFRGTVPEAAALAVDAKLLEECCGAEVDPTDRSLVVDAQGGLANAVVEVMLPGDLARGSGAAVELRLERCQFAPRISLVPIGTTLVVENRDRGTHQVLARAVRNLTQNFSLASGGRREIRFGSPERIQLSSQLVPWAAGWVIATDTRWIAVTHADGSFEIADVPSGEYALRAWHEKLGEAFARDVAIGGERSSEVEIVFGG